MLQCNSINNDESTFLILKIDWVFVGNWVLRHIKKKTRKAQLSRSSCKIFTFLCLSLIHLVKYNKYQLTKKEKSKVSSKFLKKMWLIEYRIVTTYQDSYYCHIQLHHHNSRGFHVRFYPIKHLQSLTLTT